MLMNDILICAVLWEAVEIFWNSNGRKGTYTHTPTEEISSDPPAVEALVNSFLNRLITESINHFLGFSTWYLNFK